VGWGDLNPRPLECKSSVYFCDADKLLLKEKQILFSCYDRKFFYGSTPITAWAEHMETVVKVTRRGQTTIPVEFRQKLGIKEGDQLIVAATEKGILFTPILKLEELAGVDAQYGTPEELKRDLEKLREEY
jgi:AbrB family looped-hinge helix DNA binding protein